MKDKILLFDVENAPSKAYIWQSKTYYVPSSMIFDEWYMLCWCAKWLDQRKIISSALPDFKGYNKDKSNDYHIVKALWELLDEADIVIAHNATAFDVKKANARFLYHGMTPPSPYKIVDTLSIARRNFMFTSNKLDYLGKRLGIGKKKENAGIVLWERCMEGDEKSWKELVSYCKQDVRLLEKLYKKLRPYHKTHPNMSYKYGSCPACGSNRINRRGTLVTKTTIWERYWCRDCGKWSKKRKETNDRNKNEQIYTSV